MCYEKKEIQTSVNAIRHSLDYAGHYVFRLKINTYIFKSSRFLTKNNFYNS